MTLTPAGEPRVTPQTARTLSLFAEDPDARLHAYAIARETALPRNTVGYVLRRMVDAGLMVSELEGAGRQRRYFSLTPAGKVVVRRMARGMPRSPLDAVAYTLRTVFRHRYVTFQHKVWPDADFDGIVEEVRREGDCIVVEFLGLRPMVLRGRSLGRDLDLADWDYQVDPTTG